MDIHHCDDLISIFNDCFMPIYNTQLIKGAEEPLYLPEDETRQSNELYFSHDYFASALHEVSHWLIAGEKRRKMMDFGYWYAPDGRTSEQQALFQKVEIKPQALEWIMSNATGFRFRVSVDNLNGSEFDTIGFKKDVYNQVKTYSENGLPKRAEFFRHSLCRFYKTAPSLNIEDFHIDLA